VSLDSIVRLSLSIHPAREKDLSEDVLVALSHYRGFTAVTVVLPPSLLLCSPPVRVALLEVAQFLR